MLDVIWHGDVRGGIADEVGGHWGAFGGALTLPVFTPHECAKGMVGG